MSRLARLSAELTDPYGPVLGAVAGGLTWAIGAPVLLGVGVGAAVYGAKALTAALLGDGAADAPLPRPAAGSQAGRWLTRAERAVQDLHQQTRGDGPLLAASRTADEADTVLASMRRLGAQSVAVAAALARADAPGLAAEAARLRDVAAGGSTAAQQSARAVADRLAVRDRLTATAGQLDARLQSSALGLEGLVARVAELRAMAVDAGSVDPSAGDLQALTDEVEGLRSGLAQAEEAARGALD